MYIFFFFFVLASIISVVSLLPSSTFAQDETGIAEKANKIIVQIEPLLRNYMLFDGLRKACYDQFR